MQLSKETIEKAEEVIKDYGLDNTPPSPEVLKKASEDSKRLDMHLTAEELATLDGRLKLHGIITNAIKNAHTEMSPKTKEMIDGVMRQLKSHEEAHNTIFEKIKETKDEVAKVKESWIKVYDKLEENEEKDKIRDEAFKPIIEAFNGISFLGKWGGKSMAFFSVLLGIVLSLIALFKIFITDR